MYKRLLNLIALLPLLSFLFLSCENLLAPVGNQNISFTLGSDNGRFIKQTITSSESLPSDGELNVECSLLFKDKVLDTRKTQISLDKISDLAFIFENLDFNEGYKVVIKISYNDFPIFSGETKEIALSEDKDKVNVDITLDIINSKINYELDGGTFSEKHPTQYFITSSITIPPVTKEGHTFNHWETSDGQVITKLGKELFLGDVTLHPVWDINKVTITYETNSTTSSLPPIKVDYGYALTSNELPTNITKDDYNFSHWECDGAKVESGYIIKKDITLKAQWTLWNKVALPLFDKTEIVDYNEVIKLSCSTPGSTIYYTTDGSTPSKTSTPYDDTVGIPITSVDAPTQIKAIAVKDGLFDSEIASRSFTVKKYSIIYKAEDGTIIDSTSELSTYRHTSSSYPTTFTAKDTSLTLSTVAKDGYIGKWTKDGKEVSSLTIDPSSLSDITLVASSWTPITYTVKYDPNGGDGSIQTETVTYDTHHSLMSNPFTRTNYNFDGWYTLKEGGEVKTESFNDIKVSGQSVTYYAHWTIYDTVATPTFLQTTSVDYNEAVKISCSTPGVSIYYTTDGSVPSASSSPYDDNLGIPLISAKTIKAIAIKDGMLPSSVAESSYTIKTYTVTFNNMNHGTAPNPLELHRGESISDATLTETTVTGYIFGGWYKEEGLTNQWDNSVDVMQTTPITLYAKWTPITYEVIFDRNTGDAEVAAMNNKKLTFDEISDVLTKNSYTKSGFEFDSWNTKANGSGTKINDEHTGSPLNLCTNNGDQITLYAQWNDIAPSPITGLTSSIVGDMIRLTWINPTEKDFDKVTITCEGTSISPTDVAKTSTSYDFAIPSSDLNKGSYKFIVTAYDKKSPSPNASKAVSTVVSLPKLNTPKQTYWIPNSGKTNYELKITGSNLQNPDINYTCDVSPTIGSTPSITVVDNSNIKVTLNIPSTSDVYKLSIKGLGGKTEATINVGNYIKGGTVMSDGMIIPSSDISTKTTSQTPIAVIFREADYSVSPTPSIPALGLGLNEAQFAWAKGETYGCLNEIPKINCVPSTDSVSTATFDGDTDGSNNWEEITSKDLGAASNASTNYPAFDYANNYGTTVSLPSPYTIGWFIPSISEWAEISKYCTDLNKVINALNGSPLTDNHYWSSTPVTGTPSEARSINPVRGTIGQFPKTHSQHNYAWIRCIRKF